MVDLGGLALAGYLMGVWDEGDGTEHPSYPPPWDLMGRWYWWAGWDKGRVARRKMIEAGYPTSV